MTYDAGALSTAFDASFMAQPAGGTIFDGQQGLVVIPEPGTALLIGSGLAIVINRI